LISLGTASAEPIRIAVVTGAGAGIGRATALQLAREGNTVVAVGRSSSVDGTAAQIRADGGEALGLIADCTDRAMVEGAFASIIERYGRVDVLVNNVGYAAGPSDRFDEVWRADPSDWSVIVDACLTSTMLCCRQVAPVMRELRAGKIVNVSSVSWLAPPAGFSAYAAAKAGVVGFTRVLAAELAPMGVNVNSVSPGPTRTGQTEMHPPEIRDRILATVPLGRYGTPDEIAAGIVFLTRDEAAFITGHNLVISGGRAMV
jgi:NAD(P)-dependent dehydrogenase (short-subunit alcohol dehydrogenase family)